MTDEIEVTPGQADTEPPQGEAVSTPVTEDAVAPRPLSEIVPEVLVEAPAEAPGPSEPEPAGPSTESENVDAEPDAEAETAAEELGPSDAEPTASEPTPSDAETATQPVSGDVEPEVESPATDEPSAETASAETPEPELATTQPAVLWWPFVVYGVLWLAFAGLLGWLLYSAPAGVPSVETQYYPYLVMAGVMLTLAGPLLAVVLYVGSKDETVPVPGLFAALLLRAASLTLAGVALWWIVLIAADAVRLGRLL